MRDLTILGPNQDKVIALLKTGRMSPRSLARHIYGVPRGERATKSQEEMVRRALRSLGERDFVRPTNRIWDRERLWELTDKIIPMPEKKKKAAKPGLTVVKP